MILLFWVVDFIRSLNFSIMRAVMANKWSSVFIFCELTCTCTLDLNLETQSHMAGKGDITWE